MYNVKSGSYSTSGLLTIRLLLSPSNYAFYDVVDCICYIDVVVVVVAFKSRAHTRLSSNAAPVQSELCAPIRANPVLGARRH